MYAMDPKGKKTTSKPVMEDRAGSMADRMKATSRHSKAKIPASALDIAITIDDDTPS